MHTNTNETARQALNRVHPITVTRIAAGEYTISYANRIYRVFYHDEMKRWNSVNPDGEWMNDWTTKRAAIEDCCWDFNRDANGGSYGV